MQNWKRRAVVRALGASALAPAALLSSRRLARAQQRNSVKIGYAVSKSGQNAAGAGITTIPNYALWVQTVNAAGGLAMPDGSHLPIEVIEYDDRSAAEEAVRAVERLATQDEVDFILPPWGTGFNLAIAPLMDRFGFPHLAVTAVTDKAPQFAERWSKSFWFLGGGGDYARALGEVLSAAKEAGQINGKVAMISVADGFGIDLVKAAREAFGESGLEIAMDESYPLGTSDFGTLINQAQASGADSFVGFSYPPGTFGLTQAARVASYNPKVFYLGVGVAFPVYQKANGENVDGVMSLGGVDPSSSAIQDYFARHEAVTGAKPDSWASSVTYASLQVLEQAIARVGLERDAVAAEISSGSFDTVIGETSFENNQLRKLWWTGQWQNGSFVGVSPSGREGASRLALPKPAWKA